jgi:hypothetical protein
MFMHHWSVGLARVYALQALEDEIRRARAERHSNPSSAHAGVLRTTMTGLAGVVRRLARRTHPEVRPLGCG